VSTEFTFIFPLAAGLHARPASALEELARSWAAEVTLINERTGRRASLRSVLALVGTDTRRGDRCRLTFEGADAPAARTAAAAFLRERFPHCDDALPAAPGAAGEIRLPPCLRDAGGTIWRGTAVVGGIGHGRIVPVSGFVMPPVTAPPGGVDPAAEHRRVLEALAALDRTYERLLERAAGKTALGVLHAHRAIARDPEFRDHLQSVIHKKGATAAAALADAQARFMAMLAAAGSVLLRERALDVQDVCRQLFRELYGPVPGSAAVRLDGPAIIVAENLTPGQLLELDRREVKGLALAQAAGTSHTVILARSFGIPTVAGAIDAVTVGPKSGEAVLDGELGLLVTEPTAAVRRYYVLEQRRLEGRRARLQHYAGAAGRTRDGEAIEIAANISTADEVAPVLAAGAESIGLFRTEMIFMDRAAAPTEDEQFEEYRRAVAAANGRTVIVRTLDIGGDKPLPYLELPGEENPLLGCRGVRLYPRIENLFRTQIRALLRAAVPGPLWVMIPMVANVDEVRWVKGIVAQEQARLAESHVPHAPRLSLGAMVEVPAAAFALSGLCRELDFISIGSNDLLHYFTATARTEEPAARGGPTAPVFLRLLKKIADDVRSQGRWLGLCGEMGGQTLYLPLLVGLGLNEISMAASSIPAVKARLRQLAAPDCRRLLGQALACATAAEVEALVKQSSAGEAVPLWEGELLLMDSEAATQAEAIKEICDALYVTGRTDSPWEVEEAVWQREAVYSTGFGHGFAIPHCKTRAIAANSLAVLQARRPIPWKAADGQPVTTVLLMASRDSDPVTDHLKVFSRLARQVVHDDFRQRVSQERDPAALLAFLAERLEIEDAPAPPRAERSP
jgi:fructose-specific PTS system IIA-like component